jgi:hypothetical protein
VLDKKTIENINRTFRQTDESHLWPINGKFNATERAIRKVRKSVRAGLFINDPESYRAILEDEITRIVNDERNW